MPKPTVSQPRAARLHLEDARDHALHVELFAVRDSLASVILELRPSRPRDRLLRTLCKLDRAARTFRQQGRRRG